jgi:hypothetical protein
VRSIVTGYYAEQGWDPTTGAELLGRLEALEIAEYAEHRVHAVGHRASRACRRSWSGQLP